ncbi:uncharacterized protein EI90DRAFT_3054385 [Cantharellus anzutake]|uniref:uncharacterized protein n=1 Tax=Cantharellus anzutake TaxID=1750568 RepID=UPI001907E7B5|nr:uncharacterized protein EI90DRAFT_3054385 [Cantharellus anzutake]KAF8332789.1 hypothetical protein EI90DRAFT_3054385 [Cantharellus anzutake]
MDSTHRPSPEVLSILQTWIAFSVLGSALSATLFGIITVQTFFYYKRFPTDHVFLKITFLILLSLQILLTAIDIYAFAMSLGSAAGRKLICIGLKYYRNLRTYAQPFWNLAVTCLIYTFLPKLLAGIVSQSLFVYTTFRRQWPALLISFEAGWGLCTLQRTYQNPNPLYAARLWPSRIFGPLNACCDIVVAGALAWGIHRRKNGAVSDNVLRDIMLYIACTGLSTASVSIVLAAGVVVASPRVIPFIGPSVGAVSIIGFLSNLHSRSLLYDARTQRGGISFLISVMRDVQQASDREGQHEVALWSRVSKFDNEYNVEESKTYDDNPAFERQPTCTRRLISMPKRENSHVSGIEEEIVEVDPQLGCERTTR